MKLDLVILAACLLSVASAKARSSDMANQRGRGGAIAGEAGAGLAGGALLGCGGAGLGFLIGFAFTGDADMQGTGLGMAVGAGVGIPLGTALGTYAVGGLCRQDGRWVPTLLGSLAGTVVGVPLVVLGAVYAPPLLVGALLPAIGAVVGYNLSRPKPAARSSFLDRLEPPAVALWQDGRQQTPGVDVRVVCVWF